MNDATFQFLERMKELGVNSYIIDEYKIQIAHGCVVVSMDVPNSCPWVEVFPPNAPSANAISYVLTNPATYRTRSP